MGDLTWEVKFESNSRNTLKTLVLLWQINPLGPPSNEMKFKLQTSALSIFPFLIALLRPRKLILISKY